MSELSNDQLDDIERRLNAFDALVSGNAVLADRKQLQEEVSIAEWRAVIGALRKARAEARTGCRGQASAQARTPGADATVEESEEAGAMTTYFEIEESEIRMLQRILETDGYIVGPSIVKAMLSDMLRICAKGRELESANERGRVVGTQRLRDVTLTTYERANDDSGGGE
jgi:hypothetical protein